MSTLRSLLVPFVAGLIGIQSVSAPALAETLTPLEQLSIGHTDRDTFNRRPGGFQLEGPLGVTVRGLRSNASPLREGPAGSAAFSAFVSLAGPLGMVVDYSEGRPRVGGLALLPSDTVRLEASGGIDPGFDNIRGRVSVHIKF